MELFAAQEKIRRVTEMRFDVNESGNSLVILRALLDFDQEGSENFAAEATALKMEGDPEAKSFVYFELQLIRRMLKLADADQSDAGLALRKGALARLANDRLVLNGAGIKGNGLVLIQTLRESTRKLNRPAVFRGLIRAVDLKPGSMLEREQLVREALVSDEIRVLILNASLDLVNSVALPRLPREPSRVPPPVPSVPRKVNSQSELSRVKAKIAAYREDAKKFKTSWEVYAKEVANYRDKLVPEYNKKVADLRAAFERRNQARQAYLAYLSYRQAQVFTSPQVAQSMRETSAQLATERLSRPAAAAVQPQVRTLATSRASQSASSSGPDLMDWWLFYYTQNPMWLFNHDIALWMLIFDSSNFDSSAHRHDLQGAMGLTNPPPMSEPVRAEIGAATDALKDSTQLILPGGPNLNVPGSDVDAGSPGGPTLAPELQGIDSELPRTDDLTQLALPAFADIQLPSIELPSLPDLQIPTMPDIQMPDVQVSTPDYSPPASYDSPSFDSSPGSSE